MILFKDYTWKSFSRKIYIQQNYFQKENKHLAMKWYILTTIRTHNNSEILNSVFNWSLYLNRSLKRRRKKSSHQMLNYLRLGRGTNQLVSPPQSWEIGKITLNVWLACSWKFTQVLTGMLMKICYNYLVLGPTYIYSIGAFHTFICYICQ